MTLVHRHLDVPPGTPPSDLPLDALDDLLDRGDFDDWQALAAAVRADPRGSLADRILELCRAHPMYGTSLLWPAFIARLRDAPTAPRADRLSLAGLRKRRATSQAAVGRALGISQSDVSKIERRNDLRVSTLRRYARVLGGELRVSVEYADGSTVELGIGDT
jgi:hypothetical protein